MSDAIMSDAIMSDAIMSDTIMSDAIMSDNSNKNNKIHYITPEYPATKLLAIAITDYIANHVHGQERQHQLEIWLPTRRAVFELRKELANINGDSDRLANKLNIIAVTDALEQNKERLLQFYYDNQDYGWDFGESEVNAIKNNAVVSKNTKQLLIHDIIESFIADNLPDNSIFGVYALAKEVSAFTDSLIENNVNCANFLENLQKNLPYDLSYNFSEHRSKLVDILNFVVADEQGWYGFLKSSNLIDNALQNKILCQLQSNMWRNPVFSNGNDHDRNKEIWFIATTATRSWFGKLFAAVAHMRGGKAILSCCDYNFIKDSFERYGDNIIDKLPSQHPQYGLIKLICSIDSYSRCNFIDLSKNLDVAMQDRGGSVSHFFSEIVRPAYDACKWQEVDIATMKDALNRVKLVNFKNIDEEITVISELISDVANANAQMQIAIIASDIDISSRINKLLKANNVNANHSFGQKIDNHDAIIALKLIIKLAQFELSSKNTNDSDFIIYLLALLKNHFFMSKFCSEHNMEYDDEIIYFFDLHICRNNISFRSFREVNRFLQRMQNENNIFCEPLILEKTTILLQNLFDYLSEFIDAIQDNQPLSNIFMLHCKVIGFGIEFLSDGGSDDLDNGVNDANNANNDKEGIYSQEHISDFFLELKAEIDNYNHIAINDYKSSGRKYLGNFNLYQRLFQECLSKFVIQDSEHINANIMVTSSLEARFGSYDLVILTGFNEGSCPPFVASGVISDKFKHSFNMPNINDRIGFIAHDLQMIFAASRYIVISRAIKAANDTNFEPSRWWQRMIALKEICNLNGVFNNIDDLTQFMQLEGFLDGSDFSKKNNRVTSQDVNFSINNRLRAPAPNPPAKSRPYSISQSDISLLISDPYSFYAKNILHLEPLNSLASNYNAADFGNMVHYVVEKFVDYIKYKPITAWRSEQIEDYFINKANSYMNYHNIDEHYIRAGWLIRIANIAQEFIEDEMMLSEFYGDDYHSANEIAGNIDIRLSNGNAIVIRARADRIIYHNNGDAVIIDYKTGVAPDMGEVVSGVKAQLLIEGLIWQKGQFFSKDASSGNSNDNAKLQKNLPMVNNISNKRIIDLLYWRLSGRYNSDNDINNLISFSDKLKSSRKYRDISVTGLIDNAELQLAELLRIFYVMNEPFYAVRYQEPARKYNIYTHLSRVDEWG